MDPCKVAMKEEPVGGTAAVLIAWPMWAAAAATAWRRAFSALLVRWAWWCAGAPDVAGGALEPHPAKATAMATKASAAPPRRRLFARGRPMTLMILFGRGRPAGPG